MAENEQFGSPLPCPLNYIFAGVSISLLFPLSGFVFRWLYVLTPKAWLHGPILWASYFFVWGLMLFYFLYVRRKCRLGPLISCQSFRKLLRVVLTSVIFLIVLALVNAAVLKLLEIALGRELHGQEFWRLIRYAPSSMVLIIFLLFGFTVGPVIEELYYRVFLYSALKTRLGMPIAAVLHALVFALAHGYWFLDILLPFILVGVALALFYEKMKNILHPIIVHVGINALYLAPLFVLAIQNYHTPAANWAEATTSPSWLEHEPPAYIEKKENGEHQRQYAIDSFGSKGTRRWKQEVQAFEAVSLWFPEHRQACAQARLGVVHVYTYYLRDYRRAVVQAETLLTKYGDQQPECASALCCSGFSYYMLRDFESSRSAFMTVVEKYPNHEYDCEFARSYIRILNMLQKMLPEFDLKSEPDSNEGTGLP